MSARVTRVMPVDRDRPAADAIELAANLLRQGGLVAFATETVYGLGADATSDTAIARIYAAKGRPSTNPLIIHVADVEMARRCAVTWSQDAERLAAALWPGPVTLVVPKTSQIPDAATAGLCTVGLRVPAPGVARALIRAADRPIAAPSANRSEHVSPTTAAHVLDDLESHVDIILDSGPTEVGIESSVIDLTGDEPRVLRPGPVTAERIAGIVGRDVALPSATKSGPLLSPGQHLRHYAPRTRCVRVDSVDALRSLPLCESDAVLVIGHRAPDELPCRRVESYTDPTDAGRRLYASLRALDALDLQRIVVVMPPSESRWRAIADRLVRATEPAQSA